MGRAISKTALLPLVKRLRAADVRAAVAANPALLEARDKRGRNWLHIACGVNVAQRKLSPRDSVRTADVLLDAGLALESVAFREDDGFEATPLWYAVAWGHNLVLAKHLVALGANPRPPGCTKLAGADDLWRIRIRQYRVIYQIQDTELIVTVVKVGDRKEVYR